MEVEKPPAAAEVVGEETEVRTEEESVVETVVETVVRTATSAVSSSDEKSETEEKEPEDTGKIEEQDEGEVEKERTWTTGGEEEEEGRATKPTGPWESKVSACEEGQQPPSASGCDLGEGRGLCGGWRCFPSEGTLLFALLV